MTSEKELRRLAADFIRDRLSELASDAEDEGSDYLPGFVDLDEPDLVRVSDMICSWPIPDLPPADRDGIWWPESGLKYGHVRLGKEGVTIARGDGRDAPACTPASTSLRMRLKN